MADDKVNLQDNPDNETRIAGLRRERVGLAARAEAGDEDAKSDLAALDQQLKDRGFTGKLDSEPDDGGGPATAPDTKLGRLSTGPDPRVGDPTVDVGAAENIAAMEYEEASSEVNPTDLAGSGKAVAGHNAEESAGKAKAARVGAGVHGDEDGPAPEGYVKDENKAENAGKAKPEDLGEAKEKDDKKAKEKGSYPAPQGRSTKPLSQG
jgi:hypothetical protein